MGFSKSLAFLFVLLGIVGYYFITSNEETTGKESKNECWSKECKCVAAFLFVTLSMAVYYFMSSDEKLPPLELKDEWWGKGAKLEDASDKVKIEKFQVSVEPSVIEELKLRLKNTRMIEPLDDVKFEYGMNTKYLKRVIDYWLTDYDWKKEQDRINSFPQYLMEIDGIKVHYLHVKPSVSGKRVLPLMLVHGWPGSVLEFYKAIPMLTELREDCDFVFEIICPHIPGYGFSEAPQKKGFSQVQAANMFGKLMKNLGHEKYYLQGGDWGSIVTTNMSILLPERVLGLHINMIPAEGTTMGYLRWFVGSMIPQVAPGQDIGITPNDLYPMSKLFYRLLSMSGYFHLQATKPDSVGVALSDSPAGLAAYILEKFAGWTDCENHLDSEDGDLGKHFTLDELITNVMLYWVNNTITPSVRFYKEAFSDQLDHLKIDQRPITPLSGFLMGNKEPLIEMAAFGHNIYKNRISVDHECCGHFAALQAPKVFSKSVWNFVIKAEKIHKGTK